MVEWNDVKDACLDASNAVEKASTLIDKFIDEHPDIESSHPVFTKRMNFHYASGHV